ncbi:Ran-binding protein 10 [Orbilia ellipsospora]|uniref:Ran-binding protein 10 n=1 Tax=Orbilia ellipsospora TaxID=2528407 RepID=A0AAV9X603_9PEZI
MTIANGLTLDTKFRSRRSSNASNLATPLNSAFPARVSGKEQDSQCWLEAKVRFRDRIQKSKHPPSQDNINDFLRNNINVNKAISEAEKLKARADRRYEGSLGKLLGVLSVLKDVGDSVLTCAPETVSIAWGIISLLVGIGTNDMDNCGKISEASTNIVTIILNCRLYENRHNENEKTLEVNDLADRVMEAIRELITVVLEFFWHANRKFREGNRLKKFVDIFSIKSTANEKYEAVIAQYKDLRTIAQVEFEDNVIGWLQDIKQDNAKLAERMQADNEQALRLLLLPELQDIKDKLDLVQQTVSEIKGDVKEMTQELVMFRDESILRNIELKIRERFQRHRAELSKSEAHIRQLSLTLGPLKRRLGTKHLARWLFTHHTYIDWETGNQKILYIKGQPGFGKSVAMAVAIERLLENVADSNPNPIADVRFRTDSWGPEDFKTEQFRDSPVLYFFFKRGDDETQLTKSAVSCLLAQLFRMEHAPTYEEMLRCINALIQGTERGDKPSASTGTDDSSEDEKETERHEGEKERERHETEKEREAGNEGKEDTKASFYQPSNKKVVGGDARSHDPVKVDLARIEEIGKAIGKTIYIVIDGIDECTDYENAGLIAGLVKLARSPSASFKILMSSRDITGLESSFVDQEQKKDEPANPENDTTTNEKTDDSDQKTENADTKTENADTTTDPNATADATNDPAAAAVDAPTEDSDAIHYEVHTDTTILTVNKSTNKEDMKAYLDDSLTDLLDYKSNDMLGISIRKDSHNFNTIHLSRKQAKQIESMVNSIQKKADGMFTYSAMVIASLRQPSPLSIKRRVRELPDQMDSLYAKHLDSLTMAQRKLVILALNRIVWAPQDMNTLEIVEQFKRVYLPSENHQESNEADDSDDDASNEPETPSLERRRSSTSGLDLEDPMERWMRNPEVIYTVRHLEAAGREFFKFSDGKRTINVIHKSVRDWVEKESRKAEERSVVPSANILEWGDNGEIKVTIPRLFVEGSSGTTNFLSQKETLLDILIYTLEVLTSKKFHERYLRAAPEDSTKVEDQSKAPETVANDGEEGKESAEKTEAATESNQTADSDSKPLSEDVDQAQKPVANDVADPPVAEPDTNSASTNGETSNVPEASGTNTSTDVVESTTQIQLDTKSETGSDVTLEVEEKNITENEKKISLEPIIEVVTKDSEENAGQTNEEIKVESELVDSAEKIEEPADVQDPTLEIKEETPLENTDDTGSGSPKPETPGKKTSPRKNWKTRGEISHLDYYIREVGTLWPEKERQGRKWIKLKELLRKLTAKETWSRLSPEFLDLCLTNMGTDYPEDLSLAPGFVAARLGWDLYLEFLVEDEELNYDFNTITFSPTDPRTILHIPKLYFTPNNLAKLVPKLRPGSTSLDRDGYEPFHQCLRRLSPSYGFDDDTKKDLRRSISILLEMEPKPDLNKTMPKYNDIPLCYAMWFTDGDTSIFYRILERYKDDPEKFDINFSGEKTRNSLHSIWCNPTIVSQELQVEFAKKLIECGADVNAQDIDSAGPLTFAALTLNAAGVQLLVDSGADINDDDFEGFTALGGVATVSSVEGMDSEAQEKACLEIIRILKGAGADLSIRTKGGQTPLIGCILFEKYEAAKLLLEYLAKPENDDFSYLTQQNAQRGTILHMAIGRKLAGPKIIQFVAEHLPKALMPDLLAVRDFKGRTALQFALIAVIDALNGSYSLMEVYYSLYEEKGSPAGELWVPKRDAIICFGDIICLRKLREEQNKVTFQRLLTMEPYNYWMLHQAICIHDEEGIKALVEAGIDPLHVDEEGWDAFDWAYACGQADLVQKCFPEIYKDVNYEHRKSAWKEKFPQDLKWDRGHEVVEFSEDRLSAKVDTTFEPQFEFEKAGIVTRYPVPPYSPLFYYEVTILELLGSPETSFVGVGFCSEEPNVGKMPGWNDTCRRTFGLHSDEPNRVYSPDCFNTHDSSSRPSHCPFEVIKAGDTVGCGYDQINHTIFWTLNGKSWEVEFTEVRERLYPMIGGMECHLKTNFGGDPNIPFMWDGEDPPPVETNSPPTESSPVPAEPAEPTESTADNLESVSAQIIVTEA